MGSFFDLELPRGLPGEFHRDAARFNRARSALRALFQAHRVSTVWLPRYICPVVFEAATAENVTVRWFGVDRNLTPRLENVPTGDWVLCVNYFGVKTADVERVCRCFPKAIVDNTQAFYARPITGSETIYSPRKWFGVPDGGYAYGSVPLPDIYPVGRSDQRLAFLLERLTSDSPEDSYPLYRAAEESLDEEPVQRMSCLTQSLLERIDYDAIRRKRRENFSLLHSLLKDRNEMEVSLRDDETPMFYPFVRRKDGLRASLIERKTFVATFWRGLENWSEPEGDEVFLRNYLLPLPIDQRYGAPDFDSMAQTIAALV